MKKHLSIKNKLTIWYSLVFISVSIILFVSFYLLTNRYLIYETDRSLTIHSTQIAYTLGGKTNNLHDEETKNILELSQKEAPGIFIQIVDDQGYNADGSDSIFKDLALRAIHANNAIFSQTKINGYSMRVIAYPVTTNNVAYGAVIMGHQIDVYESTLSQIRTIGILLLIFLIAPAILIGYLIAKSATDPIRTLSFDINKINSENLSRHLEVKIDSEETALLVRNFNSLLDRLNSSFNLERQFLGEMAHEIKTPLAVIKSNAEVILSKDRTPAEYKQAIHQSLDQIEKLTKNLLSLMDFAWSQSTEVKSKFTKINLSQLMLEIINIAEYTASPKQIKIHNIIDENIVVLGKEEKLYQAIYNILDNALKFTPAKGEVTLNLYKKEENAVIEITDTGIGIDKEHQKNIFNRFYRTEQNKNIAGHGLGLAIADSIINTHEGYIEVESEKNKGSTFRIILKIQK